MLDMLSLLLLRSKAATSTVEGGNGNPSPDPPELYKGLLGCCGGGGILGRGVHDRGASRGVRPKESVLSCKSGLPMTPEDLRE